MYLKEIHSRRNISPFYSGVRDDSKGCPFENEIIRTIRRFQLAVIAGERLGMGVCFLGGHPYLAERPWLCDPIVSIRASTSMPRVSAGRRDMSHVRI